MEIRYIELFAGIGGFRYGLEKARDKDNHKGENREGEARLQPNRNGTRNKRNNGNTRRGLQQIDNRYFQCVWANEIDKYACQIYRKQFGEGELYEGDIRTIPAKSIPDFDLLTAGFPCQSFSIAGKRKGFGDTCGTLFFEICRIVEAKKPNLLLLENVKGLLNHDKGNTFRVILNSLSELGYDCEWEVLNSKNFGVPQNRERVFIVGHLRGTGRQKVFPIGEGNQTFVKMRESSRREQPKTTVSGCIGMKQDREHNTYIIQREQFDVSGKGYASQQDRVYKPEGIMCCLPNAHPDNKLNIFQGKRIRRLTPTECERLQGFPDGWTEGISDSQRYKCLGNAVTTNVITEIGKKILEKYHG